MRTLSAMILSSFILGSGIAKESIMDLSEYKWKNRVIIVRGLPQEVPLKNTLEQLKASKAELKERDVVILRDENAGFKAELYGKDGGKKWESDKEFKISEITELIDSMPMRQAEKKQ